MRGAPKRSVVVAAALAAVPWPAAAAPPSPEEAVARVDGVAISRAAIEQEIAAMSDRVRRRYRRLPERRELVQARVRLELLAREAERRGLLDDPEVRRVLRHALADALIRAEQAAEAAPAEEELRAAYQSRRGEFVQPEVRRVADLYLLFSRHRGKPGARKRAQAILEEARAAPDGHVAFRALVERWSDDATTRLSGGATRYFSRDDADVPEPIRKAAFALGAVNDLGTAEDRRGVHVLRLIGLRGPSTQPFEQVRDRLERDLVRSRHARTAARLEAALREKAAVEIDERALRRVRVPR